MKSKLIIASLFIAILTSCSHSSNDEVDLSDGIPTIYMPLKINNYWKYNVASTFNGTVNPSKDSLFISNDTLINSITYKKMKSYSQDPSGPSTGFYSSIVHNNSVRIDGSRLKLTGVVNLPTLISEPITLNLSDFTIFKENSSAGTELSSVSGDFTRTIQTYLLNFNYTFKSVSDENLTSYTTNGHTYTDVKKTKLVLNLTVTYPTVISGIATNLVVLPTQDVIVSTQYYAKNIGVIYNNTTIEYALNPAAVSTLSFPPNVPTNGNFTQQESVTSYHLN